MSLFSYDDYESDTEPMAEINVTPLVDVMLVLLITFMIAMPVLTYTISIDLPGTSFEERNEPIEEPLRLSIDSQGGYFLNDTPISSEEFSA
ncbi:MAG: biopolymer transporter ExbD, partial [Neisseriaceae bacterium]|nr:biopolymer transporter ExbD [Neisseriaceae bacterium]